MLPAYEAPFFGALVLVASDLAVAVFAGAAFEAAFFGSFGCSAAGMASLTGLATAATFGAVAAGLATSLVIGFAVGFADGTPAGFAVASAFFAGLVPAGLPADTVCGATTGAAFVATGAFTTFFAVGFIALTTVSIGVVAFAVFTVAFGATGALEAATLLSFADFTDFGAALWGSGTAETTSAAGAFDPTVVVAPAARALTTAVDAFREFVAAGLGAEAVLPNFAGAVGSTNDAKVPVSRPAATCERTIDASTTGIIGVSMAGFSERPPTMARLLRCDDFAARGAVGSARWPCSVAISAGTNTTGVAATAAAAPPTGSAATGSSCGR